MLNAAFRKKSMDLRSNLDKRAPLAAQRGGCSGGGRERSPSSQFDEDDDDEGEFDQGPANAPFSHHGNCLSFIRRNSTDSPALLPRRKPRGERRGRYQKNGGRHQPSYRRLDSDDSELLYTDDYKAHARENDRCRKYGPADIEVWSKKTAKDVAEDRAVTRAAVPVKSRVASRTASLKGSRPQQGTSSGSTEGSGLKDWLSWRCFLNQNLAQTVLYSNSASRVEKEGGEEEQEGKVSRAVRTVCAQPDFGKSVVQDILEEYADCAQKPPTTLHQNDYLMFGVPRAQLKMTAISTPTTHSQPKSEPELEAQSQHEPEPPVRILLEGKPSLNLPQSFTIQRCIAERVKAAESSCLPSIHWKRPKRRSKLLKKQSNKGEASSAPDYLPSRGGKMHNGDSARRVSSDDERVRLYRNHWAHVARPRDRVALPPESSFLWHSRSTAQSSHWSTSSMTLSLKSSSSGEYSTDDSSSYSDVSSSLYSYSSKPLCAKPSDAKQKKYRRW